MVYNLLPSRGLSEGYLHKLQICAVLIAEQESAKQEVQSRKVQSSAERQCWTLQYAPFLFTD
jgi:hypothetical protein